MLRIPRIGPYGQLLEEALAILERDALVAYARITVALEGLVIDALVDQERFHLRGERRPHIVPEASGKGDVEIATDRNVLIELIDGEITLLDGMRHGRIFIRGGPAALLDLARAQRAFAEGAVRTGRMQALLTRFRNLE